jgi:diadenosine tetraphosphate (Ap4A) HIT family hydrolase
VECLFYVKTNKEPVMDNVIAEHTPILLEKTFDSIYLFDHPLYSLLAEKTALPWLLVIPKQALKERSYIEKLYGEIYQMIDVLQKAGFGPHYNIAKIGNKSPNLHMHIIFRDTEDEVWPDAAWCHEPLKASDEMPERLRQALQVHFGETV